MRIAFITDTHIGVRNDSPYMLDNFKKSIGWFFDTLEENGITRVMHGGDLFDRRKYISFVTSNVAREFFLNELEKRKIETDIIAGNHDEYYKNTHHVNSLDEIVGNRYKYIRVHTTPIEKDGILLLPWITQSNEKESIEAIKNSRVSTVFGHLELHGFEMQKGLYADEGMDFKLFNNFDAVYTGHYHHRSSNHNIHYIGAFSEFNWSDFADDRGFSIFDTETSKINFVRNPHILFKGLVYDDVKDKDMIKTISEMDYSQFKDSFVKIAVVNKTNPYLFDTMVGKLSKENPIDISIVEDSSAFIDNSGEDFIKNVSDTPTILDNYISGLTLPINTDKMKKFMREVYKEAVSLE